MTLPVTPRRDGPYSCNGSLQDFDFNFKVFAEDDIEVILADASAVETTLVLTTDYTVALNADQEGNPGGTITTTDTYATGNTVTIIGSLAYSQPTELTNRGGFFPKVIEKALDRLGILIQQLKELANRSLTLPASVSSSVSTTLPVPEANYLLRWSADGLSIDNTSPSDIATVATAQSWIVDKFSGTGAQTAFTLSNDPGSLNALRIAIDGVSQMPGADYTVSGTTLTFTTAPVSGTENILVQYGEVVTNTTTVADSAVTTVKLADLSVTTAKLAAGSVTGAKLGSMTSAELRTALSDETGSGAAVFATQPAFTNTIGVGTAAAGTGSGVSFPATQNASSDANTLDDYEEGTWTPSGNGITFSSASGEYTKIGRVVIASFDITWPVTVDAGNARVGSLPFTIGSSREGGLSIRFTNYSASNITALPVASSAVFDFYNTAGSVLTNVDLSNKIVRGLMIYFV